MKNLILRSERSKRLEGWAADWRLFQQPAKRRRYLSADELSRLTVALADHDDQQASDIIRLLLLTGARCGEVLAARWDQIDLNAGVWIKPGATTKQKTEHRIPLSAPVRQFLQVLWEHAAPDADYVFPGRYGKGHRINIRRTGPRCAKRLA